MALVSVVVIVVFLSASVVPVFTASFIVAVVGTASVSVSVSVFPIFPVAFFPTAVFPLTVFFFRVVAVLLAWLLSPVFSRFPRFFGVSGLLGTPFSGWPVLFWLLLPVLSGWLWTFVLVRGTFSVGTVIAVVFRFALFLSVAVVAFSFVEPG